MLVTRVRDQGTGSELPFGCQPYYIYGILRAIPVKGYFAARGREKGLLAPLPGRHIDICRAGSILSA